MMDFNIMKFNYESFLAEQHLLNELAALNATSKTLTESAQIEALNEDVKDAIMTYLNKIIQSVQKVWTNFKNTADTKTIALVVNDNNMKYLNNSSHSMYESEGFELPNYNEWDKLYKLQMQKIATGSYPQMSQYLDTPENFIKQYYHDYYDEKKDFKTVVNEKLFTIVNSTTKISVNNGIQDAVNFLKEYGNTVDAISKDIDVLNQSKNSIEDIVGKLTSNTESVMNLEDTMDIYFSEADSADNNSNDNASSNDNNQQSNQPNNTNSNNDSNNDKPDTSKPQSADPNQNNQAQTKDTSKDKKNVVTYFTATTKLFSIKLSMCNKIRSKSLSLCKDFITTQGQKVIGPETQAKATDNNENKPEEEKAPNNVVDIKK